MRNGFPQPPHMIGAWASTDGTTRTLRPQSHTALTRTPPPDEPCRAAGPAEGAGGLGGGRDGVRLEGAVQPVDRGPVALSRLGAEGDQREAAAGMRLLGVVKPQLLGDRQEPAVVVAAGARGVTDAAGGGDAVDCLVQQPFEGEFGATCGRRLSDQRFGRG